VTWQTPTLVGMHVKRMDDPRMARIYPAQLDAQ